MKFDELYNKLMTEASPEVEDKVNKMIDAASMSDAEAAYTIIKHYLHKDNVGMDDYITVGKELKDAGMGRDEHSLETLEMAHKYAQNDGWDFDIEGILDQIGGPSGETEYQDEYEYKGWPGDGSGEDDFADYNQMEGSDY